MAHQHYFSPQEQAPVASEHRQHIRQGCRPCFVGWHLVLERNRRTPRVPSPSPGEQREEGTHRRNFPRHPVRASWRDYDETGSACIAAVIVLLRRQLLRQSSFGSEWS